MHDEIFGFHCQPATEKLLKAILCYRNREPRKTHDLTGLFDDLADDQIAVPSDLRVVERLSPFGTQLRYEREDSPAHELDREQLVRILDELFRWALGQMPGVYTK